jgi:hypothetical protein
MKIKLDLEGQRHLQNQMKFYVRTMKLDIEDVLIERAVGLGRALANATEPFGAGKKAKDVAEGAIAGDFHKVNMSRGHIMSVIQSRSRRLAAAYGTAMREGRWQRADRIAAKALGREVRVGQVEIIQKHRNKRGRVTQAHRSVVVDDYAQALAYKAKLMEGAGTAKAAWYAAIRDLRAKGARAPAKWMRKNPQHGDSTVVRNGWKTHVVLENRVKYIKNVLDQFKAKRATEQAARNFMKSMVKKIEHNNAKTSQKLR